MASSVKEDDKPPEGLRKRTTKSAVKDDTVEGKAKAETNTATREQKNDMSRSCDLERGTYWLTRIVLLRYIAFIYLIAFLVALHQNRALVGSDGLLPAQSYLDQVKSRTGNTINMNTFSYVPSIIWLLDYTKHLDQFLDYVAYGGLALSSFIIITGSANWIIMFILWVLYHSVVNVGQRWYSFGWESQLLETGFLAIFLCPMLNLSSIPRRTPTSFIVILAYRWLIFRIMIGAGLIKIRGDQCWRDLTCMNYHYETQPVPNPVSYYMHQSPEIWHKFETLSNHFVELVAPLMLVIPIRRVIMVGGAVQILFQVVLIISGNLSFLNWLTIVPSLACFDDHSVQWMFSSRRGSARWKVWEIQRDDKEGRSLIPNVGQYIRRVFNLSLGCLIAYLSIPVVQNLLSSRQAMNTSFDPLRIVNTYGAFGSVTKDRTEVIFQGTNDNPQDPKAKWEEYEFKCKPGKITRRPCLISPYHYRLDWLMWFAAFQNYQYNPWLVHLGVKLLANDNNTLSLIAHNPFDGRDPPKYIRAEHYSYRYTKIGSKDAAAGRWWKRRHIGNYLPVISLESAKNFMPQLGFHMPKWKRKRKLR